MNRVNAYLRKNKTTINSMVPWLLMVYFIINCLPYLFSRNYILNSIFSNSIASYVLRFGFLFVLCFYGLILILVNNLKLKYPLIVVLSVLIILSFISNFTSPDNIISYSMMFAGKVKKYEWKLGVYDKLLDSFRFTAGCVLFFFLSTVFPYSFKKKEEFSYVIVPAIIIGFVGIMYTYSVELRVLIAVIKNEASPESVRSIFHSKNAYGIFLFEGAAASTYIFFTDKRWFLRICIVLLPVFFVTAYFINCRLAAVCILVLFILSIAYTIIFYFKRKPIISFALLGIVLLASLLIVLVFSIDSLHSTGILSSLYNNVISLFTNFNISSFIGRVGEWGIVPNITNGIYRWIGFSGAVGYSVVYAYTSLNGEAFMPVSDLHNAFVDFYAYHGIIGCSLLGLIYFGIIYLLYRLYRVNKLQAVLISLLFFVSILFGMAETYTLFLSISANTFVLNFLLVVPCVFFLNQRGAA